MKTHLMVLAESLYKPIDIMGKTYMIETYGVILKRGYCRNKME